MPRKGRKMRVVAFYSVSIQIMHNEKLLDMWREKKEYFIQVNAAKEILGGIYAGFADPVDRAEFCFVFDIERVRGAIHFTNRSIFFSYIATSSSQKIPKAGFEIISAIRFEIENAVKRFQENIVSTIFEIFGVNELSNMGLNKFHTAKCKRVRKLVCHVIVAPTS